MFKNSYDTVEIPVREHIRQRFQEVLDDINLSEEYRKKIKLFNVHDVDVFHAGSVFSKHGAVIGVPANFEYKDLSYITDKTISFENSMVDWDSSAARKFRESLILSENAQKFAMALKTLTVKKAGPIYHTGSLVLDILLAEAIHITICSALQLTEKQRSARFFCMGVCVIGAYILWLVTSTAINQVMESDINKELVRLGPEYVQGGIEYYEKLSSRNQALRIILGEKGTYLFTTTGNETNWSRRRAIPISEQIAYFKCRMPN